MRVLEVERSAARALGTLHGLGDIMKQAALALIAVFLSCELAESQTLQDRGPSQVPEIAIAPGRVTVIPLPRSAKGIYVGEPDIVSALPGGMSNTLVVTAKKPGSTNIVVLDNDDRTILDATILVPASTNVRMYSKTAGKGEALVHEYWAYYCTPTGCTRTDDPHEGPVLYPNLQQPPQLNITAPLTVPQQPSLQQPPQLNITR